MRTKNKALRPDLLFVLLTGVALFILVALGTYHPKDPSFSSLTWARTVHNSCGIVGSFLSDGLFQLFGAGAYLFPVFLLIHALRRLVAVPQGEASLRALWVLAAVAMTSGLLAIYRWPLNILPAGVLSGGLLGLAMAHGLTKAFNLTGGKIVLWTGVSLLALFASERTLVELLKGLRMGLWRGWKALPEVPKMGSFPQKLTSKLFTMEPPKRSPSQTGLRLLERLDFSEEETNAESAEEATAEATSGTGIRNRADSEKMDEPGIASAITKVVLPNRKVAKKSERTRRSPETVAHWNLPKMELLSDLPVTRVRVDEKEIRRRAELLKEKMAHFNVRGEVVAAKPGPMVTLYEFKPEVDVKLSKITELADDLALALSSESLRIIAPIPGRDVVGIETSNSQRETVFMKEMLAEEDFWKEELKLPIALGKQANGDARIVDLRKMPHLMVAGTTGSGKSVFTVSTIVGLLFRHSPQTLRMILIDPKQVDLAAFENLPHLLMPIITEAREAVSALRWAVQEMEKRYRSMSAFRARGLEDYNAAVAQLKPDELKSHEDKNAEMESTPGQRGETYYYKPLPYLVIVVEEFADLMATDKGNVEHSVVRLAQKARACGIHLMICMQSPRKEVVTGLIRTNFSSRIAFKVSDAMESRIVLDGTGAERLLAQGDLLFKGLGKSSLERHHGPFLKDADIRQVVTHWSDQGAPEFETGLLDAIESQGSAASGEGGGSGDYDERYDEILAWVTTRKNVSASAIQTHFMLGYPRAARVIETLSKEGVIGPANGSKPREVLVKSYESGVDRSS